MPFPTNWLSQFLTPVLRPLARFVVGLLAIPILRAIRARVQPGKDLDRELEKDLEQWFRASLVLFLATKNVEEAIASYVTNEGLEIDFGKWYIVAGRLLLAIGVIEAMPDQQLFSIIHPGPKPLKWVSGLGLWGNVSRQGGPFLKGLLCTHLNRSSAVFAILTVIFAGWEGWVFYFLAIIQYLIIGLVTSRDKAVDALSRFDSQIARRRKELIEEFEINSPSEDEKK